MPHNEQLVVEETGLIVEEALVEGVYDRNVAPVALLLLLVVVARVLPGLVFSPDLAGRGQRVPQDMLLRQIVIIVINGRVRSV